MNGFQWIDWREKSIGSVGFWHFLTIKHDRCPIQVHLGSFQVANFAALRSPDTNAGSWAIHKSWCFVPKTSEDIILVEDSKKSDCHLVRYCWNLDWFNLVCTLNTISSIYHNYISWKQYHLYSSIYIWCMKFLNYHVRNKGMLILNAFDQYTPEILGRSESIIHEAGEAHSTCFSFSMSKFSKS